MKFKSLLLLSFCAVIAFASMGAVVNPRYFSSLIIGGGTSDHDGGARFENNGNAALSGTLTAANLTATAMVTAADATLSHNLTVANEATVTQNLSVGDHLNAADGTFTGGIRANNQELRLSDVWDSVGPREFVIGKDADGVNHDYQAQLFGSLSVSNTDEDKGISLEAHEDNPFFAAPFVAVFSGTKATYLAPDPSGDGKSAIGCMDISSPTSDATLYVLNPNATGKTNLEVEGSVGSPNIIGTGNRGLISRKDTSASGVAGALALSGKNSAAAWTEEAVLAGGIVDATAGSEDGALYLGVVEAGALVSNACVVEPKTLQLPYLPSSATGLHSGNLYYDPADGNRIKYVP